MFCKYLKQCQIFAMQDYQCSDILCLLYIWIMSCSLIDKLPMTWQFYNLSNFPFLFKIKFHFFLPLFLRFVPCLALCGVDKQIFVYPMWCWAQSQFILSAREKKYVKLSYLIYIVTLNFPFIVFVVLNVLYRILWNNCKPFRVASVRWVA